MALNKGFKGSVSFRGGALAVHVLGNKFRDGRTWSDKFQHVAVGVANENGFGATEVAAPGDGDAV